MFSTKSYLLIEFQPSSLELIYRYVCNTGFIEALNHMSVQSYVLCNFSLSLYQCWSEKNPHTWWSRWRCLFAPMNIRYTSYEISSSEMNELVSNPQSACMHACWNTKHKWWPAGIFFLCSTCEFQMCESTNSYSDLCCELLTKITDLKPGTNSNNSFRVTWIARLAKLTKYGSL